MFSETRNSHTANGSPVSALHSRTPQKLDAQLEQIVERAHSRQAEFPAKQLQKAIDRFIEENVSAAEGGAPAHDSGPLGRGYHRLFEGLKVHEFTVFTGLLDQVLGG